MRDPDMWAEPDTVRRIVVLRPNHRIGNTLLLTPLMQALEAQFPKARIELVTAGGVARAVFARYPQLCAVHAFPGKSYRHPGKVLSLLFHLRRQSYDLAIDPTIRSRAGRFLLGFVRARLRLGYAWGEPGKDKRLTHAIAPSAAPAHHAEIPVYLLQAAFPPRTAELAPERIQMDIRLSETERRQGELELEKVVSATAGSGPTLGLFVHATGAKCLPPEWWLELVGAVRARAPNIRVVEFVPEDARARLDGVVTGTFTPELRLLGAKLAASSLLVIADGGIMHLADASGASVLALFQSTSPSQYRPRRPGSESLPARDLSAQAAAALISARLQPLIEAGGLP